MVSCRALFMKPLFFVAFLLASSARAADEPALAPSAVPAPSKADKIAEAETLFYRLDLPDRLDQLDPILGEIEKLDAKETYPHWARSRLAFFRKEDLYIKPNSASQDEIVRQKLALADKCHKSADACLKLEPKNAECNLMKGACYAMQASTWGISLQSLRACSPMEKALRKAMENPSDFRHQGVMPTKQIAQVFRGILYRIAPDSWWFGFLSGIRGNKRRAYEWTKAGYAGPMTKEPMVALEYAVSAICFGRDEKDAKKIDEGLSVLRAAEKVPARYPLDEFDLRNIRKILDRPDEACNYRRERFENLSESAFSKKVGRTLTEESPPASASTAPLLQGQSH